MVTCGVGFAVLFSIVAALPTNLLLAAAPYGLGPASIARSVQSFGDERRTSLSVANPESGISSQHPRAYIGHKPLL